LHTGRAALSRGWGVKQMSGRVRVDLPDGRHGVVGYRKTMRRNPRRPLHERLQTNNELYRRKFPQGWKPDVRMAFYLPDTLKPFISCGPHGVGVYVHRDGFVQVCSGSAAECFMSASNFFKVVAKEADPFSIEALITSSSHPDRKWWRFLSVVGGRVVEGYGDREPQIWG